MSTTTEKMKQIKGGEFLLKETDPYSVFTPEDYTEDQLMLRQGIKDFIEKKIEPIKEVFDTLEGCEIAPKLLEELGDLGFLGIGVPEEYGGFESDFTTQLVFAEIAFATYAFGLTSGVQTSLGVAPLLFYGNEKQKAQYLPHIVSAKLKSCYCLTEPGAGSDANSGRTKAVLTEDGKHYILNGQKMWITSAGHADLFFVFAKIEDDPTLSCLIVEKEFGGISLGAEEKKMGIKGSSTRQVFFENVKVPVENLLGERNKGFKIALHVLNTGRIKLGTSVTGSAKKAFRIGVNYANEREQFGKAIANFGAMKHKIAEMACTIYAMESIFCRIGDNIDKQHDSMVEEGISPLKAEYESIADFSIECAIAKVHNSEGVDFIVDECVQIHGGMGYSAESEIETYYRNSRINRIYEGTNEINRMLMVDMLLRKAMKGKIDFMQPVGKVIQQWRDGKLLESMDDVAHKDFAEELTVLKHLKKAVLLVAGSVVQKLMTQIKEEQEILMNLADCLIQIYTFQSALLRSIKHAELPTGELRKNMSKVLMHRAATKVEIAGKEVIYAFSEGEKAESFLKALRELTAVKPSNLKNSRRFIADYFIDKNEYKL